MAFDINETLRLIDLLTKQKKLLMAEFYEFIKYDNLQANKPFLQEITPDLFKKKHTGMDYYDVFSEIGAHLDFTSHFTLKYSVEIFLDINRIERKNLILNAFFKNL